MKKLYLLLTFVILPLQANTFPSLDDLAFSHSNPSTFKETTFDTGMHQIDSGLKAKNVDDLKDGLTKLYAAEPEVTESLFLDGSLLDREALLKSGFSKYELNSLAKAGGLNNTEATKYQTGGLTSSDKFEINVSEFQKGLESGDLNQTTEGLKKAYASGDEEVSAIKDLISSPDSEIHMNLIKTFNQEQLTQIGEAAELEPSEMNALKESRSVFEGSQKIQNGLKKLNIDNIKEGLSQIKDADPDLANSLFEPNQLFNNSDIVSRLTNKDLYDLATTAGFSKDKAAMYVMKIQDNNTKEESSEFSTGSNSTGEATDSNSVLEAINTSSRIDLRSQIQSQIIEGKLTKSEFTRQVNALETTVNNMTENEDLMTARERQELIRARAKLKAAKEAEEDSDIHFEPEA